MNFQGAAAVTSPPVSTSATASPANLFAAVPTPVNQRFFFTAALAGALLAGRPDLSAAGNSTAPVQLIEDAGRYTLDNSLLRAEIEKRNGTLISLKFHGHELLAHGGGYWSSVGRTGNRPAGQAAGVRLNTPERVEISCRTGNVGGGTGAALDVDYRYSLGRGEAVLYVSAVFHHAAGSPAYQTGESRYAMKLNPGVFDFLAVDADRQRVMPSGYDWDHGVQMNLKEARRMTTGVHQGEVEHKYDYSAVFAETPVYGWAGTKKQIGLWLINPSIEYLGGGPTKAELTGHLDVNPGGLPTLLNMWQGSHYGGTSVAVGPAEDWTKVVGPFAIYCNGGAAPEALWRDALLQATNEIRRWPCAWVNDTNYPSAAQRGAISGKIRLRDEFSPGAKMSNLWVGVAAPTG